MAATAQSARRLRAPHEQAEPVNTTLLALVSAVCDETDDEQEVVATVLHMLRHRRVRLCGNFRSNPIEDFF